MSTSHGYVFSLLALRVGGRGLTHSATLKTYTRPITAVEASYEGMTLCLSLYPVDKGWVNHSVAIAAIDPQAVAAQIATAAS